MKTDEVTPTVYVIATMDTKGDELRFVADCLTAAGVRITTVDVSTRSPPVGTSDASSADVLQTAGLSPQSLAELDRGEAVSCMAEALASFMAAALQERRVSAVIGVGGSGGTALITRAMRSLPVGLPKVMVSTVASGNTAPYVDCSDICMMYSVVDVAGLNSVSTLVLSNAAHAIAGMVQHCRPPAIRRPAVGMTMFGVTTECVTQVRRALELRGFDCLVFHATGSGGRAMEKLVESGLIVGVLDLTTTEIADEVVGGVFPAGRERFDRIIRQRIPWVISAGALDMVNFGARNTVPEAFAARRLHIHNAQVTLMRTTAEENRQFAQWIAEKINRSHAPLTILLPEGGVSALDAPGQPFHDPVADAALFDELESAVACTTARRLMRVPHHINSPEFARIVVDEFLQLMESA